MEDGCVLLMFLLISESAEVIFFSIFSGKSDLHCIKTDSRLEIWKGGKGFTSSTVDRCIASMQTHKPIFMERRNNWVIFWNKCFLFISENNFRMQKNTNTTLICNSLKHLCCFPGSWSNCREASFAFMQTWKQRQLV